MGIRDEITVLPADDPNKMKLGYKCIEVPTDKTLREYCKEIMSPEDFREMKKHMVKIERWKQEND